MKYTKQDLTTYDNTLQAFLDVEQKLVSRIKEVVNIIHYYYGLPIPHAITAGYPSEYSVLPREMFDENGFVYYNFFNSNYNQEVRSRNALAFKTVDLSYGFPVDLLFKTKKEIQDYLKTVK